MQDCLDINRKTVYDLISSHGAVEDMVFFATHMEGWYMHSTCILCVANISPLPLSLSSLPLPSLPLPSLPVSPGRL
jgi:hypothetical protein